MSASFVPPFPFPPALAALTLGGTTATPLALNRTQATAIGGLTALRSLRLSHVRISDADLARALGAALVQVVLEGVTEWGSSTSIDSATMQRLVALGSGSTPSLQTLTVSDSDRLNLARLFFGQSPAPPPAQVDRMRQFFGEDPRAPTGALVRRSGGASTSTISLYYSASAGTSTLEESYQAGLRLIRATGTARNDNDTRDALRFFERAAGTNGRGHLKAALQAAIIHAEGHNLANRYSSSYVPRNAERARVLFLAVVDDTTNTRVPETKREATLHLAHLLRRSSVAGHPAQARTYYQRLDDQLVTSADDPFKGWALLRHGEMLSIGIGGDVDHDRAIAKLNDARCFTVCGAEADRAWAKACFGKASDLHRPTATRAARQAQIWALLTAEVILHHHPAVLIQAMLYAEGYVPVTPAARPQLLPPPRPTLSSSGTVALWTPQSTGALVPRTSTTATATTRAVVMSPTETAIQLFEQVLALSDGDHSSCHHWLADIHRREHPNDPDTSHFHSLKAIRLGNIHEQLPYARWLLRMYGTSSSRVAKREQLTIAAYYAQEAQEVDGNMEAATALLREIKAALGEPDRTAPYPCPDIGDLM
jgi:hypothetical protein